MKPCKVFTSISPYLISEERWNILWNYHHSIKPVTLSKYIAEYDQIWKWMVEFLSKFESYDIKIDRVNLLCIAKSKIFFNILHAIALWVTSSLPIIFFALSLCLLPLVYVLWAYLPLCRHSQQQCKVSITKTVTKTPVICPEIHFF